MKFLHKSVFTFVLISLFLATSFEFTQTLTINPPPLHTSGHQILDNANNVVYLRGVGRTGELQSASGMWSAPGMPVADWSQKWQSISSNLPAMDATLQCYRQYWDVNLIRILVPVDWWWIDNIISTNYQSSAPYIAISYRTYIETLVVEAAKYGIYIDFCPYSAVSTYQYSGSWEGEPITGWVQGTASASFMKSVTTGAGRTEMQFWEQWWTSVVSRIGSYSNVILEMWNEPGDSQTPFFSYLIDMYQTIRGLGCQNLLFMQWGTTLIPTVSELGWVPQLYSQLKSVLGSVPTNVVFTAHPYRYAPYPNTEWATKYSLVMSQLTLPNMVPATRTTSCDVPLVFNEMGVCQGQCDSLEYSFWDAILHCALDLGVGVCPYYWISDADLGPIYGGESLLSGVWTASSPSPFPNVVGQTFLNYAPDATPPIPPPVIKQLTVIVFGNGVANPPAGVNYFPEYTLVTLSAYPNSGASFDHWELFGETGYDYGSNTNNPEWITMDQNYTLQVFFKTNATPTPTPKPTSTPTPTPTPKPSATPTPTPTRTPRPTATPTPMPTATSTPSPKPTLTPTPTPKPTATPTPTPKPTATPTPTPTPSYMFTADFETGDLSEYGGIIGSGTYSATAETANSYLGAYDAKFTASAGGKSYASNSISGSAVTYYREVVKIGTLPTSGSRIYLCSIQSTDAQNSVDAFIYNKNGKYYWGVKTAINGATYYDTEAPASSPKAGTFYNVEIMRDLTNHKTSLWIDGVLKVSVNRNHVGNANLICTGLTGADSATVIYVDCVKVRGTYIGIEPRP